MWLLREKDYDLCYISPRALYISHRLMVPTSSPDLALRGLRMPECPRQAMPPDPSQRDHYHGQEPTRRLYPPFPGSRFISQE